MIKKVLTLSILICVILGSITVYADDEEAEEVIDINQEIVQVSSETNKEPNLNSRGAVVLDRTSGKIIWGKAEYEKKPMASTTKIMTAIVVLENAKLSDVVVISKKAAGTGGSRLGLKVGDKLTVQDLLYGLMMRSGNDSAVALAEYVGGSVEGFAEKMNGKAKELGLKNTHFITPHGLDMPEHYTTPYELALIADYGLKNKKFAEIVNTRSYTVTINHSPKTLNNTNELLGNLNGVYGVKTGFTNGAGRCLVTSVKRDDLDIITVVLGADTKKFRTNDSIKMIEYTYQNYQMVDAKAKIIEEFKKWQSINEKRININKGISNTIDLQLGSIQYDKIPIHKQKEKDISVQINCLNYIEAPVEEGQKIGSISFLVDKEVAMTVDIVAKNAIRRKNIVDYFTYLMVNQRYYLQKIMEY